MPHLHTYLVSPPLRDLLVKDRKRGHVHVMSAFPWVNDDAPRAAMSILWHIDARRRLLTVQSSRAPTAPALLGDRQSVEDMKDPAAGNELELQVLIACQKTPPSQVPESLRAQLKERPEGHTPGTPMPPGKGRAYRSRLVVVPEKERLTWLARTFERNGLRVAEEALDVSPLLHANLGRRGRGIPAVEVTARGTVVDVPAFTRALRTGIGKGRTYGLGLLRTRRP
ncbi:type I-E CRISPR-associated protein Cas6/Cse3/CasE [Brevibacterium salitolerans]|uniref:Type I-E CRISPR-associated protein Cas6/Cse3/CasE n=1 Tax=Brevibacterium salitolerans TaxID=1403566 RepID=A0ABN2WM82_9MICO